MSATCLAWDYMIDVHFTFINATDLTDPAITSKHSITLCPVTSAV
jgi:hypothetical protein